MIKFGGIFQSRLVFRTTLHFARIVIFAGDVTPIDVMCHMPGVCEEKSIPYCYVPSKRDLALAVGFTNSCLMVLIREHPDYKELYDECYEEIKKLGHIL